MISLWVTGNQKICLYCIFILMAVRLSPNVGNIVLINNEFSEGIMGYIWSHIKTKTSNWRLIWAWDVLLLCKATWSAFSESHKHSLVLSHPLHLWRCKKEIERPSPAYCRIIPERYRLLFHLKSVDLSDDKWDTKWGRQGQIMACAGVSWCDGKCPYQRQPPLYFQCLQVTLSSNTANKAVEFQ